MNLFDMEESAPVSLRSISLSDIFSIVRWRNSSSVYCNLVSHDELSIEQHLRYYERYIKTGKCYQFIIEWSFKNSKLDIGTIFIKNIDYKNSKGELGIFIGENQARKKGLAKFVVSRILEVAFNDLKLQMMIYLPVIEDNIPAIKTYLKESFEIESKLRCDFLDKDINKDVLIMVILGQDWTKKHISPRGKISNCMLVSSICIDNGEQIA